ncbi:hypothetical protein G5714_004384 [Onychostoma macrolepis]|uniref:Uncharacterized protein n=1 Tax=Onychostoma macrolepis TaxID=369639 RepID=A0A7J6D4K8_9TELE|nr:hypothetical protein G5714_004384 [Onychostoma macrolepis]
MPHSFKRRALCPWHSTMESEDNLLAETTGSTREHGGEMVWGPCNVCQLKGHGTLRDLLKDYFVSPAGQVPWQEKYI